MEFLKLFSLFLCIFLVQGEFESVSDIEPLYQIDPLLEYDPIFDYIDDDSFERIINGTPALPEQFPHQVHLVTTLTSGRAAYCGGSIITSNYILTSARCLDNATSIDVRVGTNNLTLGAVHTSTDFVAHPNYTTHNLHNDIGLVKLPLHLIYNESIQVIRLPKRSEFPITHEGVTATATGFGFTINTGISSELLLYVDLKVINNTQCAERYGSLIINSTLCTVGIEYPIQSICNGDIGGPLMIEEPDGKLTHIGVSSFVSSAGCNSGNPSVYVRTGHYLDWISEVTGISITP